MQTKYRINELFKNKKGLHMIMFLMSFILIGGVVVMGYSQHKVSQIADEVMRFHVVANSDTTEDQLLKQQVKDEVITYMEPLLIHAKNMEETREIVNANLEHIKQIAKEVIMSWHKEYDVYVCVDYANFPMKAYGDVVLPAGQYEACRIILGEGKGENWWCILFPPLCYVDASTGVIPEEEKQELEEVLDDESYKIVTSNNKGEEKEYYIRFKIIDTVNEYLNKDNYKQR